MRKSTIKVIIGRNRKPQIQEDAGDKINLYTHEQWRDKVEADKAIEVKEEKKLKGTKKSKPEVKLPSNDDGDDDFDGKSDGAK